MNYIFLDNWFVYRIYRLFFTDFFYHYFKILIKNLEEVFLVRVVVLKVLCCCLYLYTLYKRYMEKGQEMKEKWKLDMKFIRQVFLKGFYWVLSGKATSLAVYCVLHLFQKNYPDSLYASAVTHWMNMLILNLHLELWNLINSLFLMCFSSLNYWTDTYYQYGLLSYLEKDLAYVFLSTFAIYCNNRYVEFPILIWVLECAVSVLGGALLTKALDALVDSKDSIYDTEIEFIECAGDIVSDRMISKYSACFAIVISSRLWNVRVLSDLLYHLWFNLEWMIPIYLQINTQSHHFMSALLYVLLPLKLIWNWS